MYLLDTNVLSEIAKRMPDEQVQRRVFSTAKDLLFASEMTRYELRYGAAIHPDPAKLWERIERKILPLPVWLPIGPEVAVATADLDGTMRRKGRMIEIADVFLAGTALVYGLVLVTRNTRHFEHVSGLELENWFPEKAPES
jgi:predicted nucleic acid-binding protein